MTLNRNIIFILLLVLSYSILPAQQKDTVVTMRRDIADFHHLTINGTVTVELSTGQAPSLRITGPKKSLEHIESIISDGGLYISQKQTISPEDSIIIRLSAARLIKIKMAGDARLVSSESLSFNGIMIDVGGNGRMDLELEAIQLNLTCSDHANVILRGSVDNLMLRMDDSSELDAEDLKAMAVGAFLNHDANAAVHGAKVLKADMQGNSKLKYSGEPELEISGPAASGVQVLED